MLNRFVEYPQLMFWLRNVEFSFLLHSYLKPGQLSRPRCSIIKFDHGFDLFDIRLIDGFDVFYIRFTDRFDVFYIRFFDDFDGFVR